LKAFLIYCLVLIIVFSNGCSRTEEVSKNLLTINNIQDALKKQEIHFQNSEIKKDYLLDSSEFSKGIRLDNGVEMYFYVFENEGDRIQGLKEVKEQTELVNTVFSPSFYEAKNVLLIYMYLHGIEGPEGKLNEAIQALRK
jgi:hypothetical protein